METCTHFWNLLTRPQYQPMLLITQQRYTVSLLKTMHAQTLLQTITRPQPYSECGMCYPKYDHRVPCQIKDESEARVFYISLVENRLKVTAHVLTST
jgi:hypothetical protein